jgi:hypothetical protein
MIGHRGVVHPGRAGLGWWAAPIIPVRWRPEVEMVCPKSGPLVAGLLAIVAGCSPRVISERDDTSVTVHQLPGTSMHAVTAEANRMCAPYGRQALPVSLQCSDDACRSKRHLFACGGRMPVRAIAQQVPPPTTPEQAEPLVAPASPPVVTSELPPPEITGSQRAPAGTPAPADDFWQRPFERPVVVRAAPTRPPSPPVEQESYFSDECAQYLSDQAMHLRCQWLTGPDRDDYIPAIGLDAPLATQMRCYPLRDELEQYRDCIRSH